MVLSLVASGFSLFAGASNLCTSLSESALGSVLLLRGKSTAAKGFCRTMFCRTRKVKNVFNAEIRRALERLEILFSIQCLRNA